MHIPRNVLVTGAAGFIGSNFVHHLLAQDAAVQVVSLDALTYAGNRQNLEGLPDAARHVFVHGDICDAALVDGLLRERRIDTVVHFAAESHVDRSISGPGEFVRTNVTGTFTLLQACRQYWQIEAALGNASVRFHHISTDEVFGTLGPEDPAFTESTPYTPNSPYSASKAASDHLVRAWFHTYGLPVVTTNCSNNFGPRQHSEKLIPTIIRSCLKGRPIPVYGDGSNVRDWLYVTDHCLGIDAVLRNGRLGECYNIGGGNEQHNLDVVRLICRVMDAESPAGAPHERLITFVTDRPGHDWRYAVNATKIQQELGWVRAQQFEGEVAETVRWYLQNSDEC
jgi:dTDP-glucose 4,6-dehydratase